MPRASFYSYVLQNPIDPFLITFIKGCGCLYGVVFNLTMGVIILLNNLLRTVWNINKFTLSILRGDTCASQLQAEMIIEQEAVQRIVVDS